jgi:hypothetical protein
VLPRVLLQLVCLCVFGGLVVSTEELTASRPFSCFQSSKSEGFKLGECVESRRVGLSKLPAAC